MAPTHTKRTWLLSILFLTEAVVFAGVAENRSDNMSAMVLQRQQVKTPWITYTTTDMKHGVLAPADTNIIFTTPLDMPDTYREDLLGHSGKAVRYWGYCFPDENDPPAQNGSLPGKIFLSEAERAAREPQSASSDPHLSLSQAPTQAQLDQLNQQPATQQHGIIRHQIDMFHGGQTCYLMTSHALLIGVDDDKDGLNSAEERKYGTDPESADTDGDGLSDGDEVYAYRTNPTNPDSDGDGLTDGDEVHTYHTDPLNKDSDGDGLCDGLCPMDKAGQFCNMIDTGSYLTASGSTATGSFTMMDCISTNRLMGEEAAKLSNGAINWTSDPTKWSTPGDGESDYQHYYSQVLIHQLP